MKIIKPKVELLIQPSGIEGIYKQIELCGRTCYKSEDKISEGSSKAFVDRMIKSNHTAMLEHGTVYLEDINGRYFDNEYSSVILLTNTAGEKKTYITTNLRVLVENGWLDDLRYLCTPSIHQKRITFRITCSRAIAQELTRHRVFSFAMESQRYCNYNKDKFNNEITFIEPYFIGDERKFENSEAYDNVYELLWSAYEDAENYYLTLIDEGFPPEAARDVLPNATKTEICMTGFESDWINFLNLRLYGITGKPHPDMKIIAEQIEKEFSVRSK